MIPYGAKKRPRFVNGIVKLTGIEGLIDEEQSPRP